MSLAYLPKWRYKIKRWDFLFKSHEILKLVLPHCWFVSYSWFSMGSYLLEPHLGGSNTTMSWDTLWLYKKIFCVRFLRDANILSDNAAFLFSVQMYPVHLYVNLNVFYSILICQYISKKVLKYVNIWIK